MQRLLRATTTRRGAVWIRHTASEAPVSSRNPLLSCAAAAAALPPSLECLKLPHRHLRIDEDSQEFQELVQKFKQKKARYVDPNPKFVKTLHECFQKPYIGAGAAKLKALLDARFDMIERWGLHSNTVMVANSSGMGKSKTLLELSNHEVFIIYCSLASRSSIPQRTMRFADVFEDEASLESILSYMLAWMVHLRRFVGEKHKQDLAAVARNWCRLHTGYGTEQVDSEAEKFSEQVYDTFRSFIDANTGAEDLRLKVKSEVEEIQKYVKQQGTPVVFIIDESQNLSDKAFLNIRKATVDLHAKCGIVFAGTSSNVSSRAPPNRGDPCPRAREKGVVKPICSLDTIDILLQKMCPYWKTSEEETWQEHKQLAKKWLVHPERWSRYGRPLWGWLYLDQKNETELLKYARCKLLNNDDGKIEKEASIALLCCTVGLEIHPLSNLAGTLSSSHMRVLADISEERTSLRTVTTTEPALSIAAAMYLKEPGRLAEALSHLNRTTRSDFLSMSRGDRCELICRILVLMAFWTCQKDGSPSETVSTEDFMKALLGVDEYTLPKSLQNSFLWFHGVVCADYLPSPEGLLEMFKRGYIYAGAAANSNLGADIIIPIGCLRNGVFELKPEYMSCILVSTKAEKQAESADFLSSCEAGKMGINLSKELDYITVLHAVSSRVMHKQRKGQAKLKYVTKLLDGNKLQQRQAYRMNGVERPSLQAYFGSQVFQEISKILEDDDILKAATEEGRYNFKSYVPYMFKVFASNSLQAGQKNAKPAAPAKEDIVSIPPVNGSE